MSIVTATDRFRCGWSALAAQLVVVILAPAIVVAEPPAAATTGVVRLAFGDDAKFVEPFAVDFDTAGNAYVAELSGGRVLRIDRAGKMTTLAGELRVKGAGGDGGPAQDARFNGMHHLAVAKSGDLYLADTWNRRIRKIDAKSGKIGTVAGTGTQGAFSGDGPADKTALGGIYCLAFDAKQESLYLVDLDSRRVHAVELATGTLRHVAGNGKKGTPRDGDDAKTSPLVDPRAIAVDSQGSVYILERSGHALRVVDRSGKIRTVVGISGKPGATGDGGDARSATLNGPKHLCVDRDDNVLIVDTENHAIRKYLPATGKIVRIAGTGQKGSTGVGGPPEKVQLNRPHGVTVHTDGSLYIADSDNHRVLRIGK